MNIYQQKYFNQNKKIYMFELNHNEKLKNINVKHSGQNLYKITNEFNNEEDVDKFEKNPVISHTTNNELFHLNIDHLDNNNNWKNDYLNNYLMDDESEFIKLIKSLYMDESNELKKDCECMYKIISETQKIKLNKGFGELETTEKIKCTTKLNKNKLYDGITNITILTNSLQYQIESVKIIAMAKNFELTNQYQNLYREIEWDLELEKCVDGYNILGLDNFIHIGLVGLEEIFFDVVYTKNVTSLDESEDLDKFGWLKFTRCYYNKIIRTNLEKNLYLNEESYSVDIIDWIYKETINIDLEEMKFGNIYNTNYNVLRIMSGMSGLRYSN